MLFLCILGEGQYINKKLYLYLSNKNQDFSGAYWSFLIDNDLTKENTLLKLPKYYFKYRDLIKKANVDDMVEQSIINEFKKFSLNSFFMLSKYINISINIEEIKDEFINIPFEYMEIEQKKDINNKMLIKFNFTLEIYKKVFEDSIKGLLKIDNLMTKMDLFGEEDTGKNGIEFEDLIVEQLWNNTFEYINFPENNKIKVKEIYELKNNINDTRDNIIISSPIIVRQTKYQG